MPTTLISTTLDKNARDGMGRFLPNAYTGNFAANTPFDVLGRGAAGYLPTEIMPQYAPLGGLMTGGNFGLLPVGSAQNPWGAYGAMGIAGPLPANVNAEAMGLAAAAPVAPVMTPAASAPVVVERETPLVVVDAPVSDLGNEDGYRAARSRKRSKAGSLVYGEEGSRRKEAPRKKSLWERILEP